MPTTTPSVYPAYGDPRNALAGRSLPAPHLGTLESLIPGLVPTPIQCADLPPEEKALHKKLAKLILDAGDAMNIPQADGAYEIGRSLMDRLYDAHRYRMRMSIPFSTANVTHPGTVLIAAISELALILRTNPTGRAPFDARLLLDLSDWLGGYCELFPISGDLRRVAAHRLYALIQQLVTYYA